MFTKDQEVRSYNPMNTPPERNVRVDTHDTARDAGSLRIPPHPDRAKSTSTLV